MLTWLVGAASADESIATKDGGVAWSVREEKGPSGPQNAVTIYHVLRGSTEVGRFVGSFWFQSNPTMRGSNSYSFHYDAQGAFEATQVNEVSTRAEDGKGGGTETIETTTTVHSWNGRAFVAGKPKVKKIKKTL